MVVSEDFEPAIVPKNFWSKCVQYTSKMKAGSLDRVRTALPPTAVIRCERQKESDALTRNRPA
ncbi:hypothetical protein GCM10007857_25990 [Bradyrhizobium iriomotense]|uniref:Uncharacterized protein n=1 Tax=Bradyrhizobium iriomotense TaxID=441950 RepID=A0ABQ6AUL2_9BRAD|nr:hypothetical protein GCM10007857_25990 [Bradyrhizobium iriomotense]